MCTFLLYVNNIQLLSAMVLPYCQYHHKNRTRGLSNKLRKRNTTVKITAARARFVVASSTIWKNAAKKEYIPIFDMHHQIDGCPKKYKNHNRQRIDTFFVTKIIFMVNRFVWLATKYKQLWMEDISLGSFGLVIRYCCFYGISTIVLRNYVIFRVYCCWLVYPAICVEMHLKRKR